MIVEKLVKHFLGGSNTGCLEMYASEKAILRYYEKNTGKKLTFEEIMSRLKDNDPESVQAVQAAGQYLGIGIANLLNGFNPSLILIPKPSISSEEMDLATRRTNCVLPLFYNVLFPRKHSGFSTWAKCLRRGRGCPGLASLFQRAKNFL